MSRPRPPDARRSPPSQPDGPSSPGGTPTPRPGGEPATQTGPHTRAVPGSTPQPRQDPDSVPGLPAALPGPDGHPSDCSALDDDRSDDTPPDDGGLVSGYGGPVDDALATGAEHAPVWELVGRAQAGDAEAFGLLYDRYVEIVFRYVHHRVGDRSTAEDFTSETFARALRRIDSLSYQGRDVGAWLVTIARNIVFDHVKSSRYRLEVSTADMRDADRATEGPEDAVLQGLTNADLLACVAQLNPEQQECIELRFLQGLSVAETAAVMGKKEGAIKALQHRAVRRLAGLLPDGLR